MKRLLIFIFLASLIIFFVFQISSRRSFAPSHSDKLQVSATIYPLAYFAQEIGLDKIQVTQITPPGIEPHDFEPKPQDLATVFQTKVFIKNGLGLEPWTEKIKLDLTNRGVVVVSASDNITPLTKNGQPDPHLWLDPSTAVHIVQNIRDGLIIADPENHAFYQANADSLIAKLERLALLYRSGLSDCRQDTIVASHGVFGYLEQAYAFHQDTLAGLSPDEEPPTQKIARLVSLIKTKDIKYILTETLLSPKLSETISGETGAVVLVFNPLESLTQSEVERHEDYFTIQEKNIKILNTALQCTPI